MALSAAGEESESEAQRNSAADPRVGRISGHVSVKAPGTLPQMVVYLESTDPQKKFPTPTTPVTVSQKDAKFSPALIVVTIGQTISFPNDEERPVAHNVFSKSSAKPFDLGLYKPGETKSVVFDKPGVVRLHCSIHRRMDGVVFVSPTPFFARVAADGSYALEDVSPGSYELRTWQRERRFLEGAARIDVKADQTVTVDLELTRN
jgi:plastocyanin